MKGLPACDRGPSTFPGALERLASARSLRAAAHEVAEEIAMPRPRGLVPVLEGVAGVSRGAA